MWAVLISLTYIFIISQSSNTVTLPFFWSWDGPLPNKVCVQWLEIADLEGTWTDNYLCSLRDYGIRWSSAGAISGMRCTQIIEAAEPDATTWKDNFLCVPPDSPLHFAWSSAGPISGKSCIQIKEPADPHTWHDNFLCWQHGFSAQTGRSNFLDGFFGGETGANNLNLNGKEIFIIALLLLNLSVMSWLYCCKGAKSNKYRKVQVFSDSEAQQLRT